MKKINLIPPEARGVSAKNWLRIQLLARRLPVIITLVVLFFVLGSLWQITAHYRYKWMLSNAKKTFSQTQARLSSLNAEAARIQEEKDQAIKDVSRLESKCLLLEEAKKGGIKWTPVLIRLSRLVPEQIWINEISLNKDLISLRGTTFDNSLISRFMVALENEGYFKDTSFNYTQKAKLDDTGVINFEVTTHLKKYE